MFLSTAEGASSVLEAVEQAGAGGFSSEVSRAVRLILRPLETEG